MWVILRRLPEKGRTDIEEIIGDEREGQERILIVLGFNDTSTLEGRFVSSPREREKRKETVEEMKERDMGRNENE